MREILLKKGVYYTIPSVLSAVVGLFFVVPLTTYFLEPSDFGVAALLASITALTAPLSNVGSGWVLTSYYFEVDEQERKVLLFNQVLLDFMFRAIVVFIFYQFGVHMLPSLFDNFRAEYLTYYNWMLASTTLGVFWPSVSTLLVLEGKAFTYFLIEILRLISMVFALAYVALFFVQKELLLYFPAVVSGLSVMCATAVVAFKRSSFSIDSSWMKKSIKFGAKGLPASILEAVSSIVQRFSIEQFFGTRAVGVYAHSQTYAVFFRTGCKSFFQVINPALLSGYARGADQKKLAKLCSWWFGLLALLGFSLGLIVSPMLAILTHGKFVGAAALILVWYFFVLLQSAGFPFVQWLIQKRLGFTFMFIQVSSSTFTIVLVLIGARWLGLYGIPIAILLGGMLNTLLVYYYAVNSGCEFRFRHNLLTSFISLLLGYFLADILGYQVSVGLALIVTPLIFYFYGWLKAPQGFELDWFGDGG